MNRILLVYLLCFSSITVANAQQTSILFVGNSYIYTANLPGTLASLALAGGDSVYHESNTPGGYTFEQHSTNTTTLNKIASRNWDFVVLQQQSQMPSFPPSQVETQTYPFAEDLVQSIKSNYECTEPVFFMTWGRRDGDQSNCAGYPPLCTFEGMNARLRESYLEMGVDNDATVAPCGAAWYEMSVRDNFFWNGLYSGDGSHPSAWGTYLNACVFYATIFRKSPVGIPFYSSIGQQDAEDLQQLAEDIVLDSLSNWFIGHQDVISDADFSLTGSLSVNFTSNASNATEHHWDFGDGTTSDDPNPQHTYATEDEYTVEYIASSNCDSDTVTLQVALSPNSIIENSNLEKVEIWLQADELTIHNPLNENVTCSVTDISGKLLFMTEVAAENIQRVPLNKQSGIYLVRLTTASSTTAKKVFSL